MSAHKPLAPEVAEALVEALAEPVAAAVLRVLEEQLPAPGGLLDAKQAARLLGVTERWMRQEARADRLPHIVVGMHVRFDRDELQAWWRSRARGPWRQQGAPASATHRLEAAA